MKKFVVAKESPYDEKFVAMIKKNQRDYKGGKGKVITTDDLDKLWK